MPTSATTFFAALLATGAMCAAPLAAFPAAHAAAPTFQAPGSLMIYSTTTGAEVEIDGKAMGKLPFEDSVMVEPGVHKIRVFLRGWTEYIDTFEVKPADEVELEIDLIPFAGIVKINTREPGATVKVDGKIEGVTPFDKDIPVGKKAIVVTRPGYYDETLSLQIKPGQEYIHDFVLRKMPGVGSDEEFYETWWFWTIVGGVAAGTATAIAVTSGGGETPPPSASFTLQIP